MFLTSNPDNVPGALLHNLKHNKVLHERNVILNVVTEDTPRVAEADRASVERLSDSFSRVTLRFGFMETPNIPRGAAGVPRPGLEVRRDAHVVLPLAPGAQTWRRGRDAALAGEAFIGLARSAGDASRHFRIPTSRAVEWGRR